MNQQPNDNTLFHLVPLNEPAADALQHPDNKRYVSLSADNKAGLEIGFHVPSISRGHVITRLGRNTDLLLPKTYSAVHLAFEIHPETRVVMLAVRTKFTSSVIVTPGTERQPLQGDGISGDCAIIYSQRYSIRIVEYLFALVWRNVEGPDLASALRNMTMEGYEDSMRRYKDVRSRDKSILPEDSTPDSWYMTRLQSSKAPLVREAKGHREEVGRGGFGKVYKTLDVTTGNWFAVKVVELEKAGDTGEIEYARSLLHREIKIMERLSHENIIRCLGTSDWHSDQPLIFMPLRMGSLHSLVSREGSSHELSNRVLQQMLRALDYLAFNKVCHRDVKPLNILYRWGEKEGYIFELADFGLANDSRLAKSLCGTKFYQAPELYTGGPQSPAMDVWSLLITILEVHPDFNFPPPIGTPYSEIVRAAHDAAATTPLSAMARIDPSRRASAAQMLVLLFGGAGLTTPLDQTPRLEPDHTPAPSLPGPSQPRPRRAAAPPVIEYPRRRHRQAPRPMGPLGVLPNRSNRAGVSRRSGAQRARPQGRPPSPPPPGPMELDS